jgi:hypothetical protein
MLLYRAALPLSSQTLAYVAGIIRRHRASSGSRWRKLNPGRQALLVLVYLRKGETFAELAACSGSGPPPRGGMWTRPSPCSRHGRRSCARRCGIRRRPGTPTWSWTAP